MYIGLGFTWAILRLFRLYQALNEVEIRPKSLWRLIYSYTNNFSRDILAEEMQNQTRVGGQVVEQLAGSAIYSWSQGLTEINFSSRPTRFKTLAFTLKQQRLPPAPIRSPKQTIR